MNVNPEQPFQLIYSLYQHQYLGFLFESYVIQLSEKGNLTLTHQNISAKNAHEFASGLIESDYELIRTMDAMQHEVISNHFSKKKTKPEEFFLKVYDPETGDKVLQDQIDQYLEKRRTKILPLLLGKMVFEMASDGEPAGRQIQVLEEQASILFHFRKNEDNTHYFPTIKLRGEKLDFRHRESYIIGNEPAWMMVDRELFTFTKPISGGKLKPFIKKKFILIPKQIEEKYYKSFIAPLIADFDVYAKGFEIKTEQFKPQPILTLSEIKESSSPTSLFQDQNGEETSQSKVLIELSYQYGSYQYKADQLKQVSVSLEKKDNQYTFHRVQRQSKWELDLIKMLNDRGLTIRNSRTTMVESEAFDWLNIHQHDLYNRGFVINQNSNGGKRYFLGESRISIEIEEKIDWFDIKAVVRFGEFEIPFIKIRNMILNGKNEIKLPNGEIGIIPASWSEDYKDLMMFSMSDDSETRLRKHHVALVNALRENKSASVSMSRKLERLLDYARIEERPLPKGFKGSLRQYQCAGYNWMLFLNEFNFGGCLADDMGLGKTVQTLALLQHEKEENRGVSLLIMPTSLIYNWEMEARRFTPKLKVLNYTGTTRIKDPELFARYDMVITSYGITRLDAEILGEFFFNYIILDESQAIKNPDSFISKAVRKLKSRQKLLLTGTPIENSTLDLWSQLSFVNPGLLGGKSYFKKEYLIPIEKKQDQVKTQQLNALIKPFILRRDKSQVASDLPEKTVSIHYCTLSTQQREYYDAEKNKYRNQILESIDRDGINKSQMILLQGLTRLRQIANHPSMVDDTYEGDSGKLEDILYMIHNALGEDHNILIFSQFVKHLRLIEKHLLEKKIQYAYLDGSVKDRKKEVEKFQEDKSVNIFLISLKAGGLGLNLTKADYVFLLDPWWNPAAEAQAIDRAHRIGQKNKVFTYKFIGKDTLEEKIVQLQESKIRLANELINVEESFVKSLTKEDIQKLFE